MASILRTFNRTQRLWRKDRLFGRPLAWEYLRLQLLHSFVFKFVPSKKIRVLGQVFNYFQFKRFLALFVEIYVDQPYVIKETPAPRPRLILDCGSNIGVSVLFFKKVYPEAKIVCFEPDPQSFALLQKNILDNKYDGDIVAHNVALADKNGTLDFYHDPKDPGNLCMSLDARRMTGAVVRVPVRRLSDYITGEVDFAKIDVEGAEDAVFQDLEKSGTLGKIQRMFIEYHHHVAGDENRLGEFLSRLEKNGFGYQLACAQYTPQPARSFQDVWIYAYRG